MKVLVGLSGGVDSTVTALILKEQGYQVIGCTMAIWGDRKLKNLPKKDACLSGHEKEDIIEAQKIAKQLDIPYYVFDCVNEYNETILKYFKQEYLNGSTPNPCVYCNALIKFGLLPDLAKSKGIEFDKFATGHYARIEENNGRYILKRGLDPKKDQSYFLYRLKQEQLKNIILPLGTYTKEKIRSIASDFGLEVASKPDSQDFFAGDYNELLEVKDKIGNIVDTSGKVLGTHRGIWNYTVGQRKGLMISSSKPLYVLSLNNKTNEVIVGNIDETFNKYLIASNLNFIAVDKINEPIKVKAKIRSSQIPVEALVEPIGDDKIKVIFDDYQKSIAKGQSVVLYDDDRVLGGGIITEAN